jgi:hypothetical protein
MSGSSSTTNTIGSSAAETEEVGRTPSFMGRFPVFHRDFPYPNSSGLRSS